MKKGSITVFFTLILSIIIVLICTCIESVKMMCARTQIANGADVGMYSLFAQYDPYLLEQYELFYVDASYGADALQMSEAYRTVEEYMEPVLNQNYLDLAIVSGGITGFALAADCNGQPFRDQVMAYMRDMPGSQGAQFLVDALLENCKEIENAQEIKELTEMWNIMARYDEEMAWAGNASAQAEVNMQAEVDSQEGEIPEEPVIPAENPIEAVRDIQKMGILELVISDRADISGQKIDVRQLASHRELEQGMGVLYPIPSETSLADQALFQEYIMQHCGTYAEPSGGGGLKYQVEYIIGKSAGDRENLERMARCLLRIREGINLAFLYGDPEKRMQSAELAEEISSGFLVPPTAGVVEEALLLCWAYGESVLEVKALFDGGWVPLQKTAQNWNLPLENLSGLFSELSVEQPVSEGQGMNYVDYLRALLFMESEDSRVMGSMDMIEADVRSQPGRENFRMDCCLESMEVEVDVQVNETRIYTVRHQYGYK